MESTMHQSETFRTPEAERVKAWRDAKRGGPPRPYHKRREPKGQRQYGGPAANSKRAAAIRQAWDCPMLRAAMRRKTLERLGQDDVCKP